MSAQEKDIIKDMHIGVQTAIFNILGLMPFFFVAIFQFKKELITNIDSTNPLYDPDLTFLVCVCFTLSVTWFALNIIGAFISMSVARKVTQSTEPEKPHELYVATTLYSVIYISVIIAVCYFFHLSFNVFFWGAFVFTIVRIVFVICWGLILSRYYHEFMGWLVHKAQEDLPDIQAEVTVNPDIDNVLKKILEDERLKEPCRNMCYRCNCCCCKK